MKALLVIILTLYKVVLVLCDSFQSIRQVCIVIGILKIRALKQRLWENSVCIMNAISAVKVTPPGSGREPVQDPSASLSLPTLHGTPPPLPRYGSNPEHCQKVKKTKLMQWGGEELRSAAKFPMFSLLAHHCNSHNLTKAAPRSFPKSAVVLISASLPQGLQTAADSAVSTGQQKPGSALHDLLREKWTEFTLCSSSPESAILRL